MIKFGYTIIYVQNVEETVNFYTKAFGLMEKLITPEKDYAELETGSTTLAFASYDVAKYNDIKMLTTDKNQPSPAFEITFVTDDINSQFEMAVKAGAIFEKSPEEKPWGQTIAYVRDINGYLIEICTEVLG